METPVQSAVVVERVEPAEESAEATPTTAELEAWSRIANDGDCDLNPEIVPTEEIRRKFLAATKGVGRPLDRMMASTWLFDHGHIVARAAVVVPPKDEPKDKAESTPIPANFKTTSPPSHPIVENAVLGALIFSPEAIGPAREALNANDFSSAERMRLFVKLCDLSNRGETITPIVIEAEFHSTGMSSLAARDLIQTAMITPAPVEALPRYYGILKDYSRRRAQMVAAQHLYSDALQAHSSPDTIQKARAVLDRVDDEYQPEEVSSLRLRAWPEAMEEAAYHGLAGEFVRLIAPRTEADPVAILAQFLICFGNVIGRKAHWTVDASRHYCNEFLVICGLTSRGRKGTSWDITKLAFDRADPGWVDTCLHTGVASGEGLIRTVRDSVFSQMKVGNEMHKTMEDAGVDDKRALWIEDELQGVLAVMKREGSTLSANLRKAWQSGSLENANKNSPMRATGAHISLIGHITFDELSRSLGQGEIGNGFANRFLWVCSRRARLLPRGGNLLHASIDSQLDPIVERLRAAIQFADDDLFGSIHVDCSEGAWAMFDKAYPQLSRTRLGCVGSVTDRAEAHVRRLAVIYALLDMAPKVDVVHLEAALAFWRYCERSVQFIFGDAEVDPVAEKIFGAIEEAGDAGLSQTQITRKLFSGRKTEEVGKALTCLVRACLVKPEERTTRGRKATVWVRCM